MAADDTNISAEALGYGEIHPGGLVGTYKILRLLGQGGMGDVYLARDVRLGRKVALKVVRPDVLGSAQAQEQFLHEARVTARFNHPHIVIIYGVGQHEGDLFVALEYLEGQTLRERLDQERLGFREALRVGLAIAEALAEAHEHGVLHRDLKPANVLLPRDGRLRGLDFGLARLVSAAELSGPLPEDTVSDGGSLVGEIASPVPSAGRDETASARTTQDGALTGELKPQLASWLRESPTRLSLELLRLAETERAREVLSWQDLVEGLRDGAEEVIQRMLEARILIRHKGEVHHSADGDDSNGGGTDAQVEIVHESLITHWDRLAVWLDESREDHAFLASVNVDKTLRIWDTSIRGYSDRREGHRGGGFG